MFPAVFGAASSVEMTVSADTPDYNLLTAYTALYGAPANAVNVTWIITTGFGVYQSAGVGGFRTGSFPAGSSIKLVVHGTISGKRGTGGQGGNSGHENGYNGNNGGPAIYLDCDVSIDVTDGLIAGGGAGGGGGGYAVNPLGGGFNGGDGGNGRDYVNARSNGQSGSGNSYVRSGDGGDGGGYGEGGTDGQMQQGGQRGHGAGGNHGTAGKAVALNGHLVTWLGGYDTTHVKGLVS